VDEKQSAKTPFYESGFFWGSVTLGASLILTAVAAIKHDLRGLLWIALPFFVAAIWEFAKRTREALIVTALGAALALAGTVALFHWLGTPTESTAAPKQEVAASQTPPTLPVAAPPQTETARKPSPPAPHKTSKPPKTDTAPVTPIVQNPPPASQAPGGQKQNCPNGICIGGDNNGTATVNNYGQPEANIVVHTVEGRDNDGSYTCTVSFLTDAPLTNPAFSLVFDAVFEASMEKDTPSISISRTDLGMMGVSRNLLIGNGFSGPNILKFSIELPIPEQTTIYVTVRSKQSIHLTGWKKGY
jgi:hypothetical protein